MAKKLSKWIVWLRHGREEVTIEATSKGLAKSEYVRRRKEAGHKTVYFDVRARKLEDADGGR